MRRRPHFGRPRRARARTTASTPAAAGTTYHPPAVPPRSPVVPGFLEALAERPLVCDGAMGTMLYERGYFINRSFDEANLASPELVRTIHQSYVRSGANVLETNTFSANRLLLTRFGIPEKAAAINVAGVKLAREAASPGTFVAGSVGPTGEGTGVMTPDQKQAIAAAFEEQIGALVDTGVDLLMFETFHQLGEIEIALRIGRRLFDGPIVAQMSFEEDGRLRDGTESERVAASLRAFGADVVGVNCCDGPSVVFDVASAMAHVAPLVAAQPNAGQPRRVDARTIYMATPEYFGVFARRYLKAGVRLIGGCCGTRPEHIAAMAAAARMMGGRATTPAEPRVAAPATVVTPAVGVEPLATEKKSPLAAKVMRIFRDRLGSGSRKQAPKGREDFAVSVEVNPAHGLEVQKPLTTAKMLTGGGADVINIADGPRAVVRMSNWALGLKMMAQNTEVLLHVCCRDRNLIGLQMDLLGAHVLGYRNLVIITGDPPKLGDYPKATPVFDLDSIELLKLVDNLNRGIDPAGKMVGERTEFFLACGAEPSAVNYDRELARLEKKVKAGAEMIMTQPVYDGAVVRRFLDDVRGFGIPILLGLCPLVSFRNAEFLHNEVPGMTVPEAIRERMKAAAGPAGVDEGVAIAREMLLEFMDEVAGAYIMPQLGRYATALKVLAPLGYEPPDGT
jgi:homocysteine S-methyltransferase